MSPDAWITLAVASLAVVVMVREWLEPALSLGAALGVLVLLDVVSPEVALRGFSSPAVAIVALLLVLAGALEGSPWLEWLAGVVFGPRGGRRSLLRALFPVAGMSAVVSNTAVVAALIPAVRRWSREVGETPSKILIPLSFAAILGGMATLIGTSTNLVVHGMLVERGGPGLGMLELARVAIPVAVVGILYLATVGYELLPRRPDVLEEMVERSRDYSARLRVMPGSSLAGTRVRDLGENRGVFVAAIERGGDRLAPVAREAVVHEDDLLEVVGDASSIAGLATGEGLEPAAGKDLLGTLEAQRRHLVEAVVSPSSPFVGERIQEVGFQARYDAIVLAVHRHGEVLEQQVGGIELHAGDTLLLITGPDFLPRWRHARDFYLVSDAGQIRDEVRIGDWLEPAVLAGVVLLPVAGLASLIEAAIGGVLLLLLTGRLHPGTVWEKLDWQVLVIIATAIGLGQAFVESGLADVIGQGVTEAGARYGTMGLVAGVLLATGILTEIVTNVAAAALMFPVATVAAEASGTDPHLLAVAVALAASASFLTPVGYQTNTMVAGAAGYGFGDFLKVGLPLKLIFLVSAVVLIPALW